MNMTGGEAIARMLKEEGVEKVFGIIDGTYFGLYGNLKKYGIELITPRHESSAVHMAGAYARITGRLGVCIASNGPGVANALPGVAVEQTEGNRVLLVTSSRRVDIIDPDRGGSFQCFDQVGVIGAMSKYSAPVRSHGRIVEIMRQAFRRAYRGRPGVVHVDVPEDIMNTKGNFDEGDFVAPARYRSVDPIPPDPVRVTEVARLLARARFPVIHAGSGVVHARAFEELRAVAERLHAPVLTSWGARGALCEENALAIPMIHVELTSEIRREADLILVLGSRIGETDWWGKPPYWGDPARQQTIQVDIDEDVLGRNRPATLNILADCKVFLRRLHEELEEVAEAMPVPQRREIVARFTEKKARHRRKLDEHLADFSVPMNTAHVAHVCKEIFEKDAIAVFDGGNTTVWAQFFHRCTAPGSGLGTPKMGMLGAGVSQALGARVAAPDRQVYCIIGDGAMGFALQEIETAVRHDLAVVYLVVCDRQWGMVKMNQQFALKPIKTMLRKSLSPEETINTDFVEIDFARVAEAMGAFGMRIEDPKALPGALQTSIAQKRPAVLHLDVDPVKHMWAPSLIHFKKMHEEPRGK